MKVSIITINYNNAEGLRRTLHSIASQTNKDYELIVVDGGSSDNSKEIIEESLSEFPANSWVSEKDNGIYNAMNKGVRMSKGDYCLFMNSGDCFFADTSLEDSIPYLNDTTEIVSGAVKTDKFSKDAPKAEDLSLSFFIKDSMNHQSTYIKRELLLKFQYNESRRIVGDSEFFFQTLILHNATYKQIPVCVSYCEAAGESGDLSRSMQERFKAIKDLLPVRMASDVDFIAKYHNPIIISIGNLLYKRTLRRLFFDFNRLRERIKR